MSHEAPLEVAVVGCGYMGTHHARAISMHPRCRLVATVDILPGRARALALRFGGEPRPAVPEGVEAVIVATPTTTHVEVATPELAAGRWCLVEKPVGGSSAAVSRLAGPRLVCGHVERFNPAIRAAGPLRPRYVEARRLGPPTGRSLDVDVVLDVMIHDLDLVLAWAEGEVEWLDAVGVSGADGRVDTVSARLRTTCGVTASLLASRAATTVERTVRVFEPGRSTLLDLRSGFAIGRGGAVTAPDRRDALTAQLDAFVGAVRGELPVAVRERDGLRAVSLAERIGALVAA